MNELQEEPRIEKDGVKEGGLTVSNELAMIRSYLLKMRKLQS